MKGHLLNHDFLIELGCHEPHRYYDIYIDQFRVYYKIEGYDCDLLIVPCAQILGEVHPKEQVEHFSDIKFLVSHHTGDWAVYINDLKNHVVTLHTKKELINFLQACKCPIFNR